LKKIETLIPDVYGVFEQQVTVSPEDAKSFGEDLSRIVVDAVTEKKTPYLRLSNLGNTCSRQLWYSVNAAELAEKLPGHARIKFLIGHITEAVILFLAKLAGHTVERQQEEVNLYGVKGHIDGIIDGELVDVKSASPYSFRKFEDGLKPEVDAFGYLSQLGGYAHSLGKRTGAFLAVDKVLGTLALDKHELPEVDYEKKVNDAKEMLASNQPPPRAFSDEPEGKSGNRKLGTKCSYCDWKTVCWPGVQQYNYSRGPVFLTKVVRPPRVDKE